MKQAGMEWNGMDRLGAARLGWEDKRAAAAKAATTATPLRSMPVSMLRLACVCRCAQNGRRNTKTHRKVAGEQLRQAQRRRAAAIAERSRWRRRWRRRRFISGFVRRGRRIVEA